MQANTRVDFELLGTLIDKQCRIGVLLSRWFGQTFHSDEFVDKVVSSEKDHAKRAMIERRQSLVTFVQPDTLCELVVKAIHEEKLGGGDGVQVLEIQG